MSRRPPPKPALPRREILRVNDEIDSLRARLIDADGDNVGLVAIDEALRRAAEANLDLVEIVPNADPPVCKILDYGKFKYQARKKANEAKKRQKVVDTKEIKMRPNIDTHDYDVKMRSMRKFLEHGDRVKVTVRFRGREMSHRHLGEELLGRVRTDAEDYAKTDIDPRMEGRLMIMALSPK